MNNESNRKALFLFQNLKEQIFAKTNFFSYYLLVFVFVIFGANFPEARVRRNSSPNPLLPSHPSGAVRNFVQNGFALNSEYATKRIKTPLAGVSLLFWDKKAQVNTRAQQDEGGWIISRISSKKSAEVQSMLPPMLTLTVWPTLAPISALPIKES